MNLSIPLHGGNLHEEASRLGTSPNQILDASASLVPFRPPHALQRCLIKSLRNNSIRNYPDCRHHELREAIATWHGIEPSMVLPGNGAAELFTWAAKEAGREGISGLPSPGFSDYERALRCWNAPFVSINLPLKWSSDSPQSFPLSSQADVLWITNPHNPTGQLWSRDSLIPLIHSHSLVICDEAFLPLVPGGEKQSLIPLIEKHSNLIVIRSLTKLFAIAGLRLGYAVSTSQRLRQWSNMRDPWPLNTLAIEAGIMLMNNQLLLNKWMNKIHRWIIEEGTWLESNLREIKGLSTHSSAVNFLLIEGNRSLLPLRENLAQQRILLRDCRSFKGLGDNWLRISLQKRSNNFRILNGIKRLF